MTRFPAISQLMSGSLFLDTKGDHKVSSESTGTLCRVRTKRYGDFSAPSTNAAPKLVLLLQKFETAAKNAVSVWPFATAYSDVLYYHCRRRISSSWCVDSSRDGDRIEIDRNRVESPGIGDNRCKWTGVESMGIDWNELKLVQIGHNREIIYI